MLLGSYFSARGLGVLGFMSFDQCPTDLMCVFSVLPLRTKPCSNAVAGRTNGKLIAQAVPCPQHRLDLQAA